MKETLRSIESWAADSNLLLNETKTKTKQMAITTTKRMSKVHNLDLTLKVKTVNGVEKVRKLV